MAIHRWEDAEPVRVMAAIGIGRMKAKNLTAALRPFYEYESESSRFGAPAPDRWRS